MAWNKQFPTSDCYKILIWNDRHPNSKFNIKQLHPVLVIARPLVTNLVRRNWIVDSVQRNNGQQSIWVTKFVYCTAILSQTVSPLLPVALEVGQVHAVDRLKVSAFKMPHFSFHITFGALTIQFCHVRNTFQWTLVHNQDTVHLWVWSGQWNCLKQRVGIHCLNPKRIAIAGKIRVFLFDKTGTLTKDGLDMIGVQSSGLPDRDGRISFNDQCLLQDTDRLTMHGLATCHALTRFGKQYVGNEVEVSSFTA